MELLLVVDMQEGFRCSESEEILPNLLKLKENFTGKLVFTKFMNRKNSLFVKQLKWDKFRNEKQQKILSELEPVDNTIEHTKYTTLNNRLQELLEKNNIEKVYLGGIYTDVCILKTAMDLFDFGIETFVIEDVCTSLHGEKNHDFAINTLSHILGQNHITKLSKMV